MCIIRLLMCTVIVLISWSAHATCAYETFTHVRYMTQVKVQMTSPCWHSLPFLCWTTVVMFKRMTSWCDVISACLAQLSTECTTFSVRKRHCFWRCQKLGDVVDLATNILVLHEAHMIGSWSWRHDIAVSSQSRRRWWWWWFGNKVFVDEKKRWCWCFALKTPTSVQQVV